MTHNFCPKARPTAERREMIIRSTELDPTFCDDVYVIAKSKDMSAAAFVRQAVRYAIEHMEEYKKDDS